MKQITNIIGNQTQEGLEQQKEFGSDSGGILALTGQGLEREKGSHSLKNKIE